MNRIQQNLNEIWILTSGKAYRPAKWLGPLHREAEMIQICLSKIVQDYMSKTFGVTHTEFLSAVVLFWTINGIYIVLLFTLVHSPSAFSHSKKV